MHGHNSDQLQTHTSQSPYRRFQKVLPRSICSGDYTGWME